MSVLTKELIAYWRAEAEKYGPPKDLALDHPSGRYISKEEYFALLYAAEVGLAMDEKMLHLLNRFGIAVEALEKIQRDTNFLGDGAAVIGARDVHRIANDALAKLELP